MNPASPGAWPADGARLLEPSISYALGAVLAVTPELLSRPTPCGEWDLRMLLRHACESLAAFGEGIQAGRVGLGPAAEDGDLAADPARAFRGRAGQLLDAWTSPGHQRQVVEIADCPLAAASWPLRRPSRSPSTGGTYPGLADSASRSRARWPPTCWRYPDAGAPHRAPATVCGAGRRGGNGRPQRPARRLPRAPARHSAHARPLIGQPRQQTGLGDATPDTYRAVRSVGPNAGSPRAATSGSAPYRLPSRLYRRDQTHSLCRLRCRAGAYGPRHGKVGTDADRYVIRLPGRRGREGPG